MKLPSACVLVLLAFGLVRPAFADELADCAAADPAAADPAKAVAACRHLAEQGNAAAQYRLGILYALGGRGVARDDAEAVKWYRKAAEQGLAEAANNLGIHYRAGAGIAQDDVQAVRWFRAGAEGGDAAAQVNLGAMYADGRGVRQDYAEAVRWYRAAAERGYATALYNLGVASKLGRGVPQDDVAAYMWMELAAQRGDDDASAKADELARALSLEQVQAGQAMAAAWLKAHPHLEPPTDADSVFAPPGRSGFTSRDRDGTGRIPMTCSGTTYLLICNGPHCQYGTTEFSLSGGRPGLFTFEAEVRKGSTYCMSCAGPPELSSCQKASVPLR
ncbi:MAG: tetratricopeptide repeat protein [Dongiaceae bacterium]